jgi:hypothetical protein
MKKTLAAIALVAMVFIASSAMAAGVKVPKLLCMQWTAYSDIHQLSLKSIGTVRDGDTKVKTYIITGTDQYGLIHGTASISPGTTTLYATYCGMNQSGSGDAISNYELFFDLTSGSGTLNYRFDNLTNQNNGTTGINQIDCTNASIPYAGDKPAREVANP